MAPVRGHMGRQEWVQLHLSLLEEERQAEVQAAQTQVEGVPARVLEARGVLLGRLVVAERSTGLYGRPVVTLTPERKDATLPANKFSAGDIVGVCEGPKQVATGVVVEVGERRVVVAGEEEGREDLDSLEDDTRITLRKLASEVTYRRIKSGLTQLGQEVNSPASHLLALLFGEDPPYDLSPRLPPKLISPSGDLQLFNDRLDSSQREAVEFALRRSDLAVIHGPPGTGKTTTLVEVIRQHVKLGCKVLVCAPSNLAVDNLVERLAAAKVRLVRLGHPARVTALTQRHTLDAILHNSEEWCVLGDIRTEMEGELARLRKARGGDQRKNTRNNIKSLRKELREKETRLVGQVMKGSEVILCTLTSGSDEGPLKHLPPQHLDLVVIDECSQATEASCYLSVVRAPKLVLAGDHCQLPPTIVSPQAAAKGLDLTLMERVIAECGEGVVRMLTQQYRMHSDIMQWASDALYQGRLTAHPSVSTHLLAHLPGVTPTEDTETAAVVVDTAGCECWELDTDDTQSKANPGEAVVVACHVKALVVAGVPQEAIAVITPYNLQVEMVRGLLSTTYPLVEVRSVDGFQGREKEAVIVSLVRSNKHGTVGFLSEDRRLNVAVTRARRHIALIGDSETTGKHPFIHALFEHLFQHGLVKTAHEFQQELDNTEVRLPECINWTTKGNKSTSKGTKTKTGREKEAKRTKPRPQPTEEDNLKRQQEYLGILKDFLKSPSLSYSFPKNLNSYERRLIHQICEELSLQHCSEGTDKERHIVVRKQEKQEEKPDEEKKEGKQETVESKESENEDDLVLSAEEEVAGKIEATVDDFINSSDEILRLPGKMNALERAVARNVCERRGLPHHSEGKGKTRRIVIEKPRKTQKTKNANQEPENARNSGIKGDMKHPPAPPQHTEATSNATHSHSTEETKHSNEELKKARNSGIKEMSDLLPPQHTETATATHNHSNAQSGAIPKTQQENTTACLKKTRTRYVGGEYVLVEDGGATEEMKRCAVCGRDVPQQNYSLHSVQCERRSREMQSATAAGKSNKENVKKKNNKKEKGKNGNKKKGEEEEEEDFDSLINKFVKENNTCSQPHCKIPTSVIYQLCPFCRHTFCLSHHMAEIHGCGDLARQQARTVISREGVLYPGSGVPSKKPKEDKRKHLERKLAKKMDDFSTKRTVKKSDKKE
ncbi:DNA-binding protein SMUBP-2-like [Scylla paramamosain]|uniref:DNA-binding protein SMUBP-2-like n=1 Tax=Scylla paramamosain TaxID=85552 RepID=UPI003082860F